MFLNKPIEAKLKTGYQLLKMNNLKKDNF